jgi:hypothetical protein
MASTRVHEIVTKYFRLAAADGCQRPNSHNLGVLLLQLLQSDGGRDEEISV